MKLKTILTVVGVSLVAGVWSVQAQTAASTPAPVETPSVSWVVTPAVVSQYMFRGVRLGGASFQPAVECDSGSLALGVWTNFPMSAKVPGVSDPEIDPYGSYTIAVNDSVSVVPGFTWYNYPNADKTAGFYKSTFEPNVAVNFSLGGVAFTPKFYYDFVLKGPTYELTAAYAVPMSDAGTELDFAATVGTFKWTDAAENTTPSLKNWGDYWQVGVSAPFKIGKNAKFVIGFAYAKGSNNYVKQGSAPRAENTAAVGRGVLTLSYSFTF